jgi:transcriptional regulator with XRE-family HTH domain
MSKKANQWAVNVGRKLKEIRRVLGIKGQDMARELGTSRNTYYRNEGGLHAPSLYTFLTIARRYNISLDWLMLDRGEMNYKPDPAEEYGGVSAGADEEVREMMEYMWRVPSLRHELLMHFYKYKEAHPEKE